MVGESLRCVSKSTTISAVVGAASAGVSCSDSEARKQVSPG